MARDDMITVEFKGGADMVAALQELPRMATRKSVARRVLRSAGQIFADRANSTAPVGPDHHLAGSYVVSTKLNKRQTSLARKEGRSDVIMYAGTDDPAGVQQEFGNRRHRAQPHARPAWEQTKKKIFDFIASAMTSELARAVARAQRKAARAAKR